MPDITKPISQVRVRFAPSPTGELHIGGARTALFNYLFAKKNKGKVFLRIEDTDRERFVPGASERIIEAINWLRLKFDGKSMIQSLRLPIYQKAARELVKKDLAYFCFCSKERLSKLRAEQERKKEPPRYDGRCRNLKQSQVQKKLKAGEDYVIRLKVPQKGSINFNDLIRGAITFNLAEIDDSVILKSDSFPTYYLASVVDDHEMKITHIIRGEEWLSSTPKNILIFNGFGWQVPQFAHIPLTLNPDRTKLSKRFGAVSILEFREMGYLPEALINFFAFLGWNPKTEREFFALEDLVEEFSLEGMGKSPAIFDIQKLDSINAYYIRKKDNKGLLREIRGNKGILREIKNIHDKDLEKLIEVEKQRMTKLRDFPQMIKWFRKEPEYKPELLIFKKSNKEKTLKGLELGAKSLEQIRDKNWNIDNLHQVLSSIVQSSKLSFGDVFWSTRAALSGQKSSPSPEELLWVLGKQESIKRIKKAITKLK